MTEERYNVGGAGQGFYMHTCANHAAHYLIIDVYNGQHPHVHAIKRMRCILAVANSRSLICVKGAHVQQVVADGNMQSGC